MRLMTRHFYERGASVPTIITIVLLSLIAAGFAAFSVWAYVNYEDQRDNVQAKIDRAVAVAEKEQADELESKFEIREKEPYRDFAGPADFGTLGFKYPKTWSLYVDRDGNKEGSYEAYLNPIAVPPIDNDTRVATRVKIVSDAYEDVIKKYDSLVKKGDLRSSAVKPNNQNGTRLDGAFSKDLRGSAVIFRIRDKTAIVQTDAETFKPDFDRLIETIQFND